MTLSPWEQYLEGQLEEFKLKTQGEQKREHFMQSPMTVMKDRWLRPSKEFWWGDRTFWVYWSVGLGHNKLVQTPFLRPKAGRGWRHSGEVLRSGLLCRGHWPPTRRLYEAWHRPSSSPDGNGWNQRLRLIETCLAGPCLFLIFKSLYLFFSQQKLYVHITEK